MRAQEFIIDALVHRAHVGSSNPNDIWHVRDDTTRKLRARRAQVVLANARPVVMSGDAMRSRTYNIGSNTGRRYELPGGYHYAYLQGDLKSQFPDNVDQGRELRFKNGRFIYADTGEPFTSADYVHFASDRTVTAYNIEQGNKLKEALHFVRPGELRGSYTDQQMQQMGFRRSQNGAWYIDQRRWDALLQQGKLREQHGVAEGYSNTTFNVDRRKLNVPALIQKGAILVTHPHGEQGWETDNKEDWAFSLLSLYNVLQGGWPSEAKKYLKPQSYKRAEQQINSSAPNLGSDKLVYDGKYNQILWSIKKLGIPDNVAFLDKDKQGVAENFADGKVKGKSRPGRVKRAGASCDGSVSSLRAKAKKYGGERGKMYHWCANMKSGRKK